MIAEKTDIQVQSTVQGERVAMSFDENSLTHLMEVLTDLYSDTERAIIREYSTNAYDSHVAVGQTRPIEVTLPTTLSPFLTIQDFGLGMDGNDISETYSKYGASTKRNTNDLSGLLGLGCKSALSYASQFTLVGVKDGRRTVVSISRDEDGAGSMTIVEESPTDAPNGVKVQIPIRRNNAITLKAAEFFRFWKPGTVLVNGAEPTPFQGQKISDDLFIIEGHNDWIVMGNVAYPVSNEHTLITGLAYKHSLVVFAPIGAVNFPPSREALQYTRKTRDYLIEVRAQFKNALQGSVQAEVSQAKTPQEALKIATAWNRVLAELPDKIYYRGSELPLKFKIAVADGANRHSSQYFFISGRNSRKPGDVVRTPVCEVGTASDGLIITGYDGSVKFTAVHKKKLLAYTEFLDQGINVENFILMDEVTAEMKAWIDPARIVSWKIIRSIRLPRSSFSTSSLTGRLPGSYDLYEGAAKKNEVASDDIRIENGIYFVNKTIVPDFNHALSLLMKHRPDSTLVVLTSNRIEKFKRTFPEAIELHAALEEVAEEQAKGVTKAEIMAHLIVQERHGKFSRFSSLDARRIDDPEVAYLVRLIKEGKQNHKVIALQDLSRAVRIKKLSSVEVPAPFERYPLLNDGYGKLHEHAHIYINAAYAAKENN